jgi:hypothetical protein
VNDDGFLELKTGTFWIDTIPLMKSRLAFQLSRQCDRGIATTLAAKFGLLALWR